eukprot:COSAG01_NODE_3818_length_5664_cov_1277.807616_4_plen_150_part_00
MTARWASSKVHKRRAARLEDSTCLTLLLLAALADNLKPQVYPPGTVVMYQGDVAGAMYFISRCRLSYQKVSRHRSTCISHSLGWPGLLSGCAEVWNQDKTQMYGVKNEGASVSRIAYRGGTATPLIVVRHIGGGLLLTGLVDMSRGVLR